MFFIIGSIGAVSLHYQMHLYFVLVTSYLKSCSVSLSLRVFRAVTDARGDRKAPHRQFFLSHKRCQRQGFLEIRKNYFRGSSIDKNVEKHCCRV